MSIECYIKDNEGIWFLWPVIAIDNSTSHLGFSIAWLNWQLSADFMRSEVV